MVIRGATLMLGTGKTMPRGTIILDKGKIAVVAEGDLPAAERRRSSSTAPASSSRPASSTTHSHMGVYPMIDTVGTRRRQRGDGPRRRRRHRPADAFWPQDPSVERAVAGGVTTVQVLPGSANLIGGRAITIKLRPCASAREMHVPGAPDGLKMACGENPKRVYGSERPRRP